MAYKHSSKSSMRSTVKLIVIFIICAWLFFIVNDRMTLDRKATPRAVTARGDLAQVEKNAIDIFKEVSPAVVYITSVALQRNYFSLNVYEIPKGTGSGFMWDEKGNIVTNFHVIEDAERVEVTLADNTTWKADLVGVAPDKDIAVIKIKAPKEKIKPILVGEAKNLLVGQNVYAIGNPFGLDQTMTSGIVSALGREIKAITGRTIQGVIQTDAAINPGNSGGPLLDSAGRLIGVNTAIYSPSGANTGIGFAVPVEVINRVVAEIIVHGKVIRPGIGVMVANDKIAQRLGIEGVLIINVYEGSQAEARGLKGTYQRGGHIVLGDVIQRINGVPIDGYDALRNELDRYQVGDEITLDILRGDASFQVTLTLEEL